MREFKRATKVGYSCDDRVAVSTLGVLPERCRLTAPFQRASCTAQIVTEITQKSFRG